MRTDTGMGSRAAFPSIRRWRNQAGQLGRCSCPPGRNALKAFVSEGAGSPLYGPGGGIYENGERAFFSAYNFHSGIHPWDMLRPKSADGGSSGHRVVWEGWT